MCMDLFEEDYFALINKHDKGFVEYYSNFFTSSEANELFDLINNETEWKREKLRMYGKEMLIPRDTAWYGDKSYVYSGIENNPLKWTQTLLEIKDKIENKIKSPLNSLLINRYKNGNDKVGWHSDDEPELSSDSPIASLTLGQERDFQFRMKGVTGENITVKPESGSVLIMHPPLQEYWEHSIPPRKGHNNPRINLTFRHIK